MARLELAQRVHLGGTRPVVHFVYLLGQRRVCDLERRVGFLDRLDRHDHVVGVLACRHQLLFALLPRRRLALRLSLHEA